MIFLEMSRLPEYADCPNLVYRDLTVPLLALRGEGGGGGGGARHEVVEEGEDALALQARQRRQRGGRGRRRHGSLSR